MIKRQPHHQDARPGTKNAPPAHGHRGPASHRGRAGIVIRRGARCITGLALLVTGAFAADGSARGGTLDAGVGIVDITPTGPVWLAGSPGRLQSSSIGSRLYARALALSDGRQKVVIVTLDTLKYPVEQSQGARQQIEKATGIPVGNIIICASHTHRGPLWTHYPDQLLTPITGAVALAVRDLAPCTLGVARGRAEGLSECRRVIKDGHVWNRWQLKAGEADRYPAEGPADPEFDVLAITTRDGRHKAVVYNFACHATDTRELSVSADFPGDVHQHIEKHLGREVATLFLTGACGDINPISSERRGLFGEKLGGAILRCLERLDPISDPALAVEARELQMSGREHPELKEEEIARNWPGQLEHYKMAFANMKQRARPTYPYSMTGIRIGDDFAIVTNAGELFCSIAMGIKRQSPFRHTMTVEQTNGAHGYVPTEKAFEGGSYETWFGEHSYLTTKAGEIIERESLDILRRLKGLP